jgi:hypothetical protein
MVAVLKMPFIICDPYTHQVLNQQPYHIQTDQIWCDGTFKN